MADKSVKKPDSCVQIGCKCHPKRIGDLQICCNTVYLVVLNYGSDNEVKHYSDAYQGKERRLEFKENQGPGKVKRKADSVI